MLINGKEIPRFEVIRHPEHPIYCHQVIDNLTGETYGFGLVAMQALALAVAHDMASQTEDVTLN